MRIVAGTHGSRVLKTLSGQTTRPTTDKVRGAIFSKIGPYFDGGTFLDVFGGSGAMALEAISRGMHAATIIEKDSRALKVIQDNVMTLNVTQQVTVQKGDALTVTKRLSGTFDVIFMDPPYAYTELPSVFLNLIEGNLLHTDSIVIVEMDSRADLSNQIGDWHCYDTKSYGISKVKFYEHAPQ
ncbi:16S rRNA (guanine(966)-N(2))-methyltransferase RsmD [Erysipelothrix anatis]|uniref:16S rRNA (guanine(966)-N(2))-methyltransferase RsmD n=1 Tax=Erysipelothrix anatis TaxID=2683713 RepID=UPI00135AEB8F|nr:16S rRNA (guanine(966)-N(2))-methyltransferase RsmD [Erysipelothrix anatis]